MKEKPGRSINVRLTSCLVVVGLSLVFGRLSLAEKVDKDGGTAEFVGAQMCLSCHADRENFKMSLHANKLSKMKGIEFEKTCETCHGPGSLHAQAAGDKTNSGYYTIKKLSSGQAAATCLQCHQDQERVHWEGSTHERRNVTCTNCHSVHDPKSPHKLLVKASEAEVCFQCHLNIKGELRRNSHMPVLEGKMSCSDCHNPHGSATNSMLVDDNVNQLCLKCHTEKRGPFVWTHPPVQENCLTCHVPHGSHNDKMLTAKLPMLCQRCHFNGGHNNSPYDASQAASQYNRMADKSCANCHINIHGSNHPSGKYFVR